MQKCWTNKVIGAIWFLFFQRQMVVFWMQRCVQKQWCETKPLFAEIAVHYCGEMVTGGSSTSGKLESGDSESECVFCSSAELTNHGTAAAPGPASRAHRPHPLYNRRPGSGAPVQCRCSYWQHRSGHQHPWRWQIFSNGPNIFRVWSPGLTSAAGHTSTVPRPPVVCPA